MYFYNFYLYELSYIILLSLTIKLIGKHFNNLFLFVTEQN